MAILKTILKNKFSLKYHGIGDWATAIYVGALLENTEAIIQYYNSINYVITSEDEFKDYLTLETIIKYQEIIENLKSESDKIKLQNLIENLTDCFKRYKNPLNQIYELINSQYLQLLDMKEDYYNKYEFIDIVLSYIFNQHDRINNDVFTFILLEIAFSTLNMSVSKSPISLFVNIVSPVEVSIGVSLFNESLVKQINKGVQPVSNIQSIESSLYFTSTKIILLSILKSK